MTLSLRKALKLIGQAPISLLDAILAIFLTASAILLGIAFRIIPRKRRRRIALLVPGADIASIHRKYGTLSVYFQDNPSKYFEKCYRFLFGAPNNSRLELRQDFIVYERKIPRFHLKMTYIAKLILEISVLTIRKRVSILHARDPYLCGLVMWVASKVTCTPFCVSIHADYDLAYAISGKLESPVIWGSRAAAKRLERFILSHAPMVLPIRTSLAKYAIRNGARRQSIRIIPHGIDMTPYRLRNLTNYRKLLRFGRKRIICFVGRLSKYNYTDDVLEIAHRMTQRRDDVVFLLVGDGEEKLNMEARCRQLNLTDVVRFVGYMPRETIPDIRRMADVNLCLMAGFSLIEGCAAGRPVVSYDVDWHSELVRNGETGYLIPEHNVKAAVDAICRLLENPRRSRAMGENARRLAFEHHSMEKTDEIKVRAYKELLRFQSGPSDK